MGPKWESQFIGKILKKMFGAVLKRLPRPKDGKNRVLERVPFWGQFWDEFWMGFELKI